MTKRKFILACVLAVGTALLCSCAALRKPAMSGPAYVMPLNEGVREIVLTDMERDVVRQLNDLRANPKGWADRLKGVGAPNRRFKLFGQDGKQTRGDGLADGTGEAVLFLENVKPLPPFKVSAGLCLAARDLVKDHGPKGLTGHKGSDGSTSESRLARYGGWDGKWAENLIYGYGDADGLMTGLLTEGGSQGWDQRNKIFDKDFHVIGLACGPHHVYRAMCVIDFMENYKEMP
jgi:hypothetical protein